MMLARSSEDADDHIGQKVPDRYQNEALVVISSNHEIMNGLTSSEARCLLLKESEGDEWPTVNHERRVRSIGSMERTQSASKKSVHIVQHAVPIKEKEQKSVTVSLTEKRRKMLRHRQKNILTAKHSSSLRDGPYNPKGRGIYADYAQEWVQEIIPQASMDVVAQATASRLNSTNQWYEKITDEYVGSKGLGEQEKTHQSSHPCASQPAKPAKSQPATQRNLGTGTARQIWNIGRQIASWQKPTSSFPPDSGSDATGSDIMCPLTVTWLIARTIQSESSLIQMRLTSPVMIGLEDAMEVDVDKTKPISPIDYDPGGKTDENRRVYH